jgi:uncharacterized protein (TIGR01777 family)
VRILVLGGTGLVGTPLCARLAERGDQVLALTRRPEAARGALDARVTVIAGDPGVAGEWQEQVAGCQAVVNLVGEPIMGKRWNPAQKERLRASRVDSAARVAEAIARAAGTGQAPAVWVNASAMGYYGPQPEDGPPLDESAPPGSDFVARLCVDWEAGPQAFALRMPSVRVVRLRIGVVLAASGGALEEMARPFRLHAGGYPGSGRQVVSWIHLEDLLGLLLRAIDDPAFSGPINCTAPSPVPMAEVAAAIGRALGRRSWTSVPGFVIRAALGEVASAVLTGQRVVPRAALAAGFGFRFTDVDAAVRDLLGSSNGRGRETARLPSSANR